MTIFTQVYNNTPGNFISALTPTSSFITWLPLIGINSHSTYMHLVMLVRKSRVKQSRSAFEIEISDRCAFWYWMLCSKCSTCSIRNHHGSGHTLSTEVSSSKWNGNLNWWKTIILPINWWIFLFRDTLGFYRCLILHHRCIILLSRKAAAFDFSVIIDRLLHFFLTLLSCPQ